MDRVITREDARALIEEIIAVCERHGLWISHEDAHGAFLVERESTAEWLRGVFDPQWSRLPARADVEGERNA